MMGAATTTTPGFVEALGMSLGVIGILFVFGCCLVAQRMARDVLLRQAIDDRFDLGGAGCVASNEVFDCPTALLLEGDEFARSAPLARAGGGAGGPVIPACPEAGEDLAGFPVDWPEDWDAFHEAGDRRRMMVRATGLRRGLSGGEGGA